MAHFDLSFKCHNDFFQGEALRPQIANILREVAARVEAGDNLSFHRNILDANNNIIGTFVLKNNG